MVDLGHTSWPQRRHIVSADFPNHVALDTHSQARFLRLNDFLIG